MSGITVTPRSRRTASASGVVGPFAPSATIVALTRAEVRADRGGDQDVARPLEQVGVAEGLAAREARDAPALGDVRLELAHVEAVRGPDRAPGVAHAPHDAAPAPQQPGR